MNPIQKYAHIIELSACTVNMFVFVFFWPRTSLSFAYKAIQCVPKSAYSSRLITYAPFFIVLGKLSLE